MVPLKKERNREKYKNCSSPYSDWSVRIAHLTQIYPRAYPFVLEKINFTTHLNFNKSITRWVGDLVPVRSIEWRGWTTSATWFDRGVCADRGFEFHHPLYRRRPNHLEHGEKLVNYTTVRSKQNLPVLFQITWQNGFSGVWWLLQISVTLESSLIWQT